jgi:4-hydroxy-tetrahydrodipicolinate synthase
VIPVYQKEQLKGVVVSLPTPTTEDYRIDYDRFNENVSWLIEKGLVEGKAVLMCAGGFGEGYFLTREEHRKIMQALVETAEDRVPTMTGVFQTNTREAIERAKMAEEIGIDFLLIFPPRYTQPVDEEVFTHYKMINDAADVGIVLYNTPWSAMNYEIKANLVERLIPLKNVVGAKWTSYDPVNLVTVYRRFSDRLNIIDNSTVVSLAYRLGAKGFISLYANVAPGAILHLVNLLEAHEYDEFDAEYAKLHSWRDALRSGEIDCRGLGEGTNCKALMEAAGKQMGPPLPPQRRISETDVRKLRKYLTGVE